MNQGKQIPSDIKLGVVRVILLYFVGQITHAIAYLFLILSMGYSLEYWVSFYFIYYSPIITLLRVMILYIIVEVILGYLPVLVFGSEWTSYNVSRLVLQGLLFSLLFIQEYLYEFLIIFPSLFVAHVCSDFLLDAKFPRTFFKTYSPESIWPFPIAQDSSAKIPSLIFSIVLVIEVIFLSHESAHISVLLLLTGSGIGIAAIDIVLSDKKKRWEKDLHRTIALLLLPILIFGFLSITFQQSIQLVLVFFVTFILFSSYFRKPKLFKREVLTNNIRKDIENVGNLILRAGLISAICYLFTVVSTYVGWFLTAERDILGNIVEPLPNTIAPYPFDLLLYFGIVLFFDSISLLFSHRTNNGWLPIDNMAANLKHQEISWIASIPISLCYSVLNPMNDLRLLAQFPLMYFSMCYVISFSVMTSLSLVEKSSQIFGKQSTYDSSPTNLTTSSHPAMIVISIILLLYFLQPSSIRYTYTSMPIVLFKLIILLVVGLFVIDLAKMMVKPVSHSLKSRGINDVVSIYISNIIAVLLFLDVLRTYYEGTFYFVAPISIVIVFIISSLLSKNERNKIELILDKPHSQRTRNRPVVSFIICTLVVISSMSTVYYVNGAIQAGMHPTSEVKVAVVDSGINANDPFLASHILLQKSFITIENGYAEDDNSTTDESISGHGTLVARQILEIYPNAGIINAKALYREEGKDDASGPIEGIVSAIYWCVDIAKADIINLSLGSMSSSKSEKDAIEYAWNHSCLVVCAAGNEQRDYPDRSTISYPSGYEHAISVAALERNGSLSDYSSWGPTNDRYMKPDIAAPAVFLSYPYSMGTSLATPWVSGSAAALIDRCMSLGVSWTPGMLKAALLAGADPINYPEYKTGVGKLNLAASIRLLENAPLINNIPFLIQVSPTSLPFDLDPLYVGCPYDFYLTIVCSTESLVTINIEGTVPTDLNVSSSITINQSARTLFTLDIEDIDLEERYEFLLDIRAHHQNTSVYFSFSPTYPRNIIALDFYHMGSSSSLYTDYEPFYSWLKEEQIAIYEIRRKSCFTPQFLRYFDTILLDGFFTSNRTILSDEEKASFAEYYALGGSIGLFPYYSQNNITLFNESLEWMGVSIDINMTKGNWNVSRVHPITNGLTIPDRYLSPSGILLSYNSSFTALAAEGQLASGSALLITREDNGRMLVSGFRPLYEDDSFGNTGFWNAIGKRVLWWLLGEL